jgi:hypothetical protein
MTYYAKIERYFIQKRGRGLMLSPKDWQVMTEWEEQQIPLRVVLKGIDNTFCQKGSLKQEVNFLAYCKPQVNKCWQEHKKQCIGAAESPVNGQAVSNQFVLQHLSVIQKSLETKLNESGPLLGVWQQAKNSLAGLISSLQNANISALDQWESKLNIIRQQLLEGIKVNMPKEELQQIEADVEAELKGYRRWMQTEAYRATYEELVNDRLCRHYGLPQLRLYEI